MNKFMLMIFTLFAFTLVGCGSKSDKEECEKDDKKQWNEEEKKCEDKPAEDSEEAKYTVTNKHETLTVVVSSDTASKELAKDACVTVTATQAAKLKISYTPAGGAETVACDNSDADTANDCKANNLEVAAKADDANAAEAKEAAAANANCTDTLAAAPVAEVSYTVTNNHTGSVSVESGTVSATVAAEGCVNVKASEVAALKISLDGNALCDADDATEVTECGAKNFAVKADGNLDNTVAKNANCGDAALVGSGT